MSRLPRLLWAEGFLRTDRETRSLLVAFAHAGVFRLSGAVVGTDACRLFQGDLGVRFSTDELAPIGDIGFASFERLSVALGGSVEEELGILLRVLRFDPVPGVTDCQIFCCRHAGYCRPACRSKSRTQQSVRSAFRPIANDP